MLRTALVMLWTVLCLTAASARTIHVSPGPGTPIQDAIASAAPGDTIRLEEAEYPEAVTIDKPLRLLGARRTPPLFLGSRIHAQCSAPTALDIAADDVRVKRVSVSGGTVYTVDVENRTGVKLEDLSVSEPAVFGCGGVLYGINVYNSRDVFILGCNVYGDSAGYTGPGGYQDAGIYVGNIPSDGNVRVKGKRITGVTGNLRGIIIEDSSELPGGKRGVRLDNMVVSSNATGIFLHNADNVLIQRNVVNDARGSGTAVGIEADGGSDDNLIKGNRFVDATTDVVDNGSSNCWAGNEVETGTVPTGGCDD